MFAACSAVATFRDWPGRRGRVDRDRHARVRRDVRGDTARDHQRDADRRPSAFGVERLGQELDGSLRGAVHGLARDGQEAAHARHVDDVTCRPREQDGQEGAVEVERPPPVDVEDAIDRGVVEILDLHERLDDPGAMDEPIDRAEAGDDLLGESGDGVLIGDVDDEAREPIAGRGERLGLLEGRRIDVDGGDSRPATERLERDGAADPAARARDHDGLACQFHVSLLPRPVPRSQAESSRRRSSR